MAGNYLWVKSFLEDNGQDTTFALDSGGVLWEENVTTTPGVLNPTTAFVLPNNYAKSVTELNEEWICYSDLLKGQTGPMHGSNFDRVSQVGPGAPPAVVGTAAGTNIYTIVASPTGLTQPAAASDPAIPGHFEAVNWSAGPTSTAAGNVLTIFYSNIGTSPQPDPLIVAAAAQGGAVYLSLTSAPFTGLTGTYIITSVGQAFPPHGSGAARWYFTVQVAQTGNSFVGGPGSASGTYQITLATMTVTTPAAINVGDQVTIAAATNASWDGTWTILNTVNGSQLAITGTSLASNIATYTYTIITGGAPATGALVTVTGCVNGPIVNGTSIFNVSKTAISGTAAGSFSVVLNGPTVVSAAETATAIISGTVFQFDPGLNVAGTSTTGILGNSGGGTVSTGGVIGSGVRQAVTIFQTRNGYLTAPSPPVIFETTGSTNNLIVSNIAIGPPNVIARIVAFTGSNGGNFFYIPVPVTIQGTGQPVTYTSTVINDNLTTQATFTFTDAVLLAATAIDVQGNNLFSQIELGSPVWDVAYAGRMFYGLANSQVNNFVNLTFDGGYNTTQSAISPLGWTVDPTNGTGGTVTQTGPSTLGYAINATGSIVGLITQSAYQDFYKVPIININTTYSIRVLLRKPIAGAGTGSLIIDLASSSFQAVYASFNVAVSGLNSNFQKIELPWLSIPFTTQVPQDLTLRVYGSAFTGAANVEIERIEIFPTLQPQQTTNLIASYVDNLEAFDGVTGILGVGEENNQPALGAVVLYDILYILKTHSMFSTQDSPNNEPASWTVREVSNKIGTCGPNAYDYGEEWMVTACREGLFLFSGGEPVKISQEIQPTWDAINWSQRQHIWLRNDTVNRKVFIGVPMTTPNQWLPDAPVNLNPTTPNVVLMMNYKELSTANALEERGPVKIAYSGKLITWDMSRKWSIWQIPAFYADFVTRPDGSQPLFYCQAGNVISQQITDLRNDNGQPIDSNYTTYGFVQPDQEQQFGPLIGDHRKLARYLELNVSGSGQLDATVLTNTLQPQYPYSVPGGINLQANPLNNVERPLNTLGNRFYLSFTTSDLNAGFQLSEVKMTMTKDPHAQIRGVSP